MASVEVINGMLFVTDAALKDHLVWFIPSNIFSRLIAMDPPANRVEGRESDCPPKNFQVVGGRQVHFVQIVIAKIGVKELGSILLGC